MAERTQLPEIVRVRPYARLLTMLGEQLIKNDRIALLELIKNSYDADASRATVEFLQFDSNYHKSANSMIAITDDGDGMTETVIRNHWLNPATPGKAQRKLRMPRTRLGRIMQGEKGIGRFALFKLGSKARITTRARDSKDEFVLEYDLSFLDEDQMASSNSSTETAQPTYLDEFGVSFLKRIPTVFNGRNSNGLTSMSGTRIEITNLRSEWSPYAVKRTYADTARLQPIVPPSLDHPERLNTEESASDFKVRFFKDVEELSYRDELEARLFHLFNDRSVLRVRGNFDNTTMEFRLAVNEQVESLRLTDPAIAALRVFKRHFENPESPRSPSEVECGPFSFAFFVFDMSSRTSTQFHLDADEKELVREHRIYLYRDDIRVLPYGDAEDDWLQLDIIRGTQGASRVLSNDQTVGFVYISQDRNPSLRDKTNREGLIETGNAYGDFVTLLQIVISYLRRSHFARYLAEEKKRLTPTMPEQVRGLIQSIADSESSTNEVRTALTKIDRAYRQEKSLWQIQAQRTEDLAGVGLSVEAASHDIVASANQALRHARQIASYVARKFPQDLELGRDVQALVDSLAFVSSRLQDIQGLFVSTRQVRKPLNLLDYVSRAERIYSSMLREHSIHVDKSSIADDMLVNSTEAAILQVLINLFDNATYWLALAPGEEHLIRLETLPDLPALIFADNGPGVRTEDEPFIFEPFYSGKGDEGKGLGLYISRQVGARNGFSIELITRENRKILPGANFMITFQ